MATQRAVESLWDAREMIRHYLVFLLAVTTLLGLALGGLAGVVIADFKLAREFRDSIQGYAFEATCPAENTVRSLAVALP